MTGILTCCLALALAVPGFAGPLNHSAVFVLNKANYIADNQTKTMDASTFMENNRVYVPVRYLALALGVPENSVLWDAASRTATL
ncbi:MAG: stalk domain-containing protein, partial [Bacillota bacterium]